MNSNLYKVPYLSQNSYLYGMDPPVPTYTPNYASSDHSALNYKDELLSAGLPKPGQDLSLPTFSREFPAESWDQPKLEYGRPVYREYPEANFKIPKKDYFPQEDYLEQRDETHKSLFLSKIQEQLKYKNESSHKQSEEFNLPSFRSENNSVKFIESCQYKPDLSQSLLEELENKENLEVDLRQVPYPRRTYKPQALKPRKTLDDMLDSVSQGPKKHGTFSCKHSEQSIQYSSRSNKPKKSSKPRKKRKNSSSSLQPRPLQSSQPKTSTEKGVFVDVMMRILKDHAKNCKVLRHQIDKVKFSKFFNV